MSDAEILYRMAQNHQAEMRAVRQVDGLAGRDEREKTVKSRFARIVKDQPAVRIVIAALTGLLNKSSH